MIVIGLISGTSADGTDACVVEIEGTPPDLSWQLHHFNTLPHPESLRADILNALQPETSTVDKLCTLNVRLGEQFAQATLTAIKAAGLHPQQVDLIGSHGQTVWHAPDDLFPSTLQLGEAAVIAERTGIPVVNNFRARDMAAGGQGAPLAPYLDVLLLSHPERVRAAQNIGGIGNVTFLPSSNQTDLAPLAFDTGPGNVLLDLTAAQLTNGQWQYDHNGEMAAGGQVNADLLAEWLTHPYLQRHPPKSTGRELYTAAYAELLWVQAAERHLTADDVMATLTAFTAHSIAEAYQNFLSQQPQEVIVSGGGASNPTLMAMLAEVLAPATVLSSSDLGLPSDAKEAIAFAIMAYETWHRRPGNLPAATGAQRAVVLGQLTM